METETRAYTAVFALQMPKDTSEEEWAGALKLLQGHFDIQWAQTSGLEHAWTVTIHDEDRID